MLIYLYAIKINITTVLTIFLQANRVANVLNNSKLLDYVPLYTCNRSQQLV